MKKCIVILVLGVISSLVVFCTPAMAQIQMSIVSSKQKIELEEQTEINILLQEAPVAALSLEIVWDQNKLEYRRGPENANVSQGRVLYTWVSSNGKNVSNLEIGGFIFRAKQEGTASIVVTGDFYREDGTKLEISSQNLELQIGQEKLQLAEENNEIAQWQIEDTTTAKLAVMRLGYEGISPDFSPDIHEYYLTVPKEITNIDVTAIAQNQEATVTIMGNTNIKQGMNTIQIEVQSADKTNTEVYTIYVTNTPKKEQANANLETLAIRQGTLTPEFDANITHYTVDLAKEIEALEILAIPQSLSATVNVQGGQQLQIGDNRIIVEVTAENKITTKKYEIIAHRRNAEEQVLWEKEQEEEKQQLSNVLQTQKINSNFVEEEQQFTEEQETKKQEETVSLQRPQGKIIVVTGILFLILLGWLGYRKYKKQKKT